MSLRSKDGPHRVCHVLCETCTALLTPKSEIVKIPLSIHHPLHPKGAERTLRRKMNFRNLLHTTTISSSNKNGQHRMKKLVILTSVTNLILTGCLNKDGDVEDEKSFESRMIVNRLNTIHGGIAHSNALSASGNAEKILTYKRMMLSESSTNIESTALTATDCDDHIFTFNSGPGSGTLTSTSRITTAHHVAGTSVRYTDYNDTVQHVNDHHKITFGSADNTAQLNNAAGRQKENPLLAKRLFALGLDNWAKQSQKGVRSKLRWWSFILDEEGQSQNFVALEDPTATPPKYRGPDFVVLKTKDDSHPLSQPITTPSDTNNTLQSGLFDFNTPGAFFTTAPLSPFNGSTELCPSNNLTKLYSSMFTQFPDNELTYRLPVTGDGNHDAVGRRSVCLSQNQCQGSTNPVTLNTSGSLINVTYTDCMYTTLDAIGGCSGGGILSRSCTYLGDGQYDPSSPIFEKIEQKGVVSFVYNKNSSETGRWSDSPTHSYPEGGNADLATKDGYSSITLFNEEMSNWASRDQNYHVDGDPFNPLPSQPSDDGCPGSESTDGFTCRVTIAPSESTGYASPGDTFTYDINKRRHANGSSNPNQTDGDPNIEGAGSIWEMFNHFEDNLNSVGFEFIPCFDPLAPEGSIAPDEISSRTWNMNFSGIQGFIGSTNNSALDPSNNELRVDALTPICVPWSSSPWVSNWSWTRAYSGMHGDVIGFDTAVSVIGHSGLGNGFKVIKSFLFGLAEERESTIHPPSMKTCPPNYYMSGVKYLKTSPEHNAGEVVGITDLICRAHAKPYKDAGGSFPKVLTVPLKASSSHDGYKFSSGTSDLDYDISARIGLNENATWTHEATDECDDRGMAVAYVLQRTPTSGNISYFHLYCAAAPNGGVK